MEFRTNKQAKDFLADRIAAEAKRGGAPLSEVERKMLYFSETDWTLPEMATVSAEFDRDYDENEYEQKIAALVRSIEARNHAQYPEEESLGRRSTEVERRRSLLDCFNHNGAGRPDSPTWLYSNVQCSSSRPPHDRLKLWGTAFAVVIGIFTVIVRKILDFGH